MIKKNSALLLGCLIISNVAIADLDNDQLTGDLLLESTDSHLKTRQKGVEKIRVKKQGHDTQQLTADELEQRFKNEKKHQPLPKKASKNSAVKATEKVKKESGDKFFWFFERDNHKDSDKQIIPDPLLDEL